MNSCNHTNELQHHGILGMKWGVRRTPVQLGRTKGGSKSKSDGKNKIKEMSDDELRKAVSRLQLEKQYSQLTGKGANRGKQFAQKIFKAGTTVAAVSTTAITIHNNAGKINDIIKKISK